MTIATEISPAALVLLAKEAAAAKKTTRDALTVGDTDVDEIVTLHLTGTVRTGAAVSYTHLTLPTTPYV